MKSTQLLVIFSCGILSCSASQAADKSKPEKPQASKTAELSSAAAKATAAKPAESKPGDSPASKPSTESPASKSTASHPSPKSTANESAASPTSKSALEHNNKGVQLGMKGEYEKAILEHINALMDDPCNEVFRTNLSAAHLIYGKELLKAQKKPQAEQQFRRALFVDPHNFVAKKELNELTQGAKSEK